ncbi:MAG: hypothetical protein IPM60_10030 [Rhodospirillales bacterium]|nr:hypothetical protein [Rhodospirillales bacterium]
MAGRLRVARLNPSGHVPLAPEAAATPELHRRLTAVIRRHLPPVTASLLTLPAPTADGRLIEWYSDLAGQPVPLPALPEAEQAAARAVLHERLTSVRDLADRLPAIDPDSAGVAEPLRQALSYPGDDTVYVVGGQPVLTFWGYASAAPPAPPVPPPVPPTETATQVRSGLPWWLWLLIAALLAAALAIGAWWYYRDLRWPPWVDYEALSQDFADEEAALRQRANALEAELRRRLDLCRLRDNLAAARRDERDLLQRSISLHANLATSMQLCPLKAQVQAAAADGLALQARAGAAEARLAQALDACRRQADAEEARRQAEEEARRNAEEERRKQEVTSPGEDLKIPESACRTGSTEFFNGRWKTTARDLANMSTGAPVVFIMDVRNATGQRTLFEYNRSGEVRCVAPIRVRMDQCRLIIEDTRRMRCENGSQYELTRFSCSAGADRRAMCSAKQETLPFVNVEIERLK